MILVRHRGTTIAAANENSPPSERQGGQKGEERWVSGMLPRSG